MALKMDCVGLETKEYCFSYDWKDAILYALSVGAKRDDELCYLYEQYGPAVFSTFGFVPSIEPCKELIFKIGANVQGMVHGGQSIECVKPFAPSGELKVVGKVEALYDLRRFAQAVILTEVKNENQECVCRMRWNILFLMDGDFGGPRPPKRERVRVPSRAPDMQVSEKLSEEQALFYRLNGDINPIHADPKLAKSLGFEKPILHGLCTLGFLERAILRKIISDSKIHGEENFLSNLSGQFSKPIFPGDTLVIQGWQESDRWVFQAFAAERPEDLVLTQGVMMTS